MPKFSNIELVDGSDPRVRHFLARMRQAGSTAQDARIADRLKERDQFSDILGMPFSEFCEGCIVDFERNDRWVEIKPSKPSCWSCAKDVGNTVPYWTTCRYQLRQSGRNAVDCTEYAEAPKREQAEDIEHYIKERLKWYGLSVEISRIVRHLIEISLREAGSTKDGWEIGNEYEENCRSWLLDQGLTFDPRRWFVFIGNERQQFRQVDWLEHHPDYTLIFEFKADLCESAIDQCFSYYVPLARSYYGKPAKVCVVTKTVLQSWCPNCRAVPYCEVVTLPERGRTNWSVVCYDGN